MLMCGRNLYGLLDGSIPSPTQTISQNNQDVDNPYSFFGTAEINQFKNAILASNATLDPLLLLQSLPKLPRILYKLRMRTNLKQEFSSWEIEWLSSLKILVYSQIISIKFDHAYI